jgi:hypothetical protein
MTALAAGTLVIAAAAASILLVLGLLFVGIDLAADAAERRIAERQRSKPWTRDQWNRTAPARKYTFDSERR